MKKEVIYSEMIKHPAQMSLRWKQAIVYLWVFSLGTISYISLSPQLELPIDFWNADKFYHFLSYGWLAILPMFGLTKNKTAVMASLSMILLGILLEVSQYYIPGRLCSWFDVAANSAGVITGLFIGQRLRNRHLTLSLAE